MEYRFADCILDTAKHRLTRGGVTVEVEPQVFALLQLLAESGGDLVTRDAMIERVWSGRIVSESTVSARINAARVAVGDSGRAQAVIRTVVSRGLQMAVPVETVDPRGAAPGPSDGQAAERPEVRFATSADGTGLAWAASGDGPALMRGGHWLTHLEHDWDNPVWRPLLDRLGAGRRLVRYDVRGTGVSQRDAGPQTLDALVEDMRAVADAAGLEAFDIFAPSQNVPVAVTFAARHPDRVRRLVLLGGFVQGPAVRGAEDKALSDAFVALVRGGWGPDGAAFMRSLSAFFMPDASDGQIEAFVTMLRASISPEAAVVHRQGISRLDASDAIADVRAPTLVIHATGDMVQPFAQGQLLARRIPNARFLALDSRNHIPLPQDPAWERMMGAVEAFLAEA